MRYQAHGFFFSEQTLNWPIGAVLALAMTGPSLAQTVTCEVGGSYRHCFDHHGYLSTEERSGDYTHGWTARATRGPSGGAGTARPPPGERASALRERSTLHSPGVLLHIDQGGMP
jgi:hypothetical protein